LFIFIALIAFLQECNKIAGYIMALFLQFIICMFWMTVFITISVDKNVKKRKLVAFTTNIFFPMTAMILIFNDRYSHEIFFQLINQVFLISMIPCIKKCVKIKNGDDLSYLKEMNH
jgi:hypothetical protein